MAQMQSRAMRLAAGLVVALLPALAHDMARSESKIQIRDHEVRAAVTLNLLEFHDPVLHFDPTGHMTVDDLDRDIGAIYDSVKRHYILRGPDAPVRSTLER